MSEKSAQDILDKALEDGKRLIDITHTIVKQIISDTKQHDAQQPVEQRKNKHEEPNH